jgi:hypothetical protein
MSPIEIRQAGAIMLMTPAVCVAAHTEHPAHPIGDAHIAPCSRRQDPFSFGTTGCVFPPGRRSVSTRSGSMSPAARALLEGRGECGGFSRRRSRGR